MSNVHLVRGRGSETQLRVKILIKKTDQVKS